MKTTLLIAALMSTVFNLFSPHSAPAPQPQKHALLIGIGSYSPATKWRTLNSDRDVTELRKAWIASGFDEKNVLALMGNLTLNDIRKSLSDLAKRVKPGDHVVIHFSGHGQQTRDDDKNEEDDGLDEMLVPWDAPSSLEEYRNLNQKVGEKHYRDDDFGKDLEAIRRKLGPDGHLLVFIDSCFSGTVTKGPEDTRIGRGENVLELADPGRSRKTDYSGMGDLKSNENALSKFVVITASRSYEKNYEYSEEHMGSLSFAITVALQKGGLGRTYRQFFTQVAQQMARIAKDQNPTIEGDLDANIFSMGSKNEKTYFTLLDTLRTGEMKSVVYLNGGRASGIFPGDIVDFVEQGKSKDTITVSGKVVNANLLQCTVKLDKETPIITNQSLWAYVRGFGQGRKLRYRVAEGRTNPGLDSALKLLKMAPYLTEDLNDPQVELEMKKEGKFYSFRYTNLKRNASSTWVGDNTITTQKVLGTSIRTRLLMIMAGEEISSLPAPHDDRLSVSFKPVLLERTSDKKIFKIKQELDSADDTYRLPENTLIGFKIKNTSNVSLHYYIVNIESTGRASPVYPINEDQLSMLGPGKEYIIGEKDEGYFEVTDTGLDSYCVFLSNDGTRNLNLQLIQLRKRENENVQGALRDLEGKPEKGAKGPPLIESSATIMIKMVPKQ